MPRDCWDSVQELFLVIKDSPLLACPSDVAVSDDSAHAVQIVERVPFV